MRKKKWNTRLMYPALIVEVKCRRDLGFKRLVRSSYGTLDNGKKVFLFTECDMHCHTETCTRCCNAVTLLLTQIENGLREKPPILDPEEVL